MCIRDRLYPIINRQDLEAKQNIFEEDLFLYRCPHCGHYQRISYECMYYDEKLKYAVEMCIRDRFSFLYNN